MCESCTQALSGLVGGIVSLISFILFPMIQIIFASLKLLLEKLNLLKNN